MIPTTIKRSIYEAIRLESEFERTRNPDSLAIYLTLKHAVEAGRTKIIEEL